MVACNNALCTYQSILNGSEMFTRKNKFIYKPIDKKSSFSLSLYISIYPQTLFYVVP